MKSALITGILGQDGPYLAKLLIEKGYKVYGLVRRYSNPNYSNLDFLGITDNIEYLVGDLTDESSLYHLIKSIRPDEIYNLAAQSYVGSSWDLPMTTTDVNALGVLRLLNGIKLFSPQTKFYQASTSEIYGNSQTNGAQNEDTPFQPTSPYAIAKLYAYWMTVNYRKSHGLFTTNGILFNHESPIRGREFVTRKITQGVVAIKLGEKDHISLGNLDARRDWGFAGDYVEAMWLMMQLDQPDDFVVATGHTYSVRDALDIAFSRVGISDWTNYVRIDPRFKRPSELNVLTGDASKAKRLLNWEPKTEFKDLIESMVDADMARARNK